MCARLLKQYSHSFNDYSYTCWLNGLGDCHCNLFGEALLDCKQ